LGEGEGGREGMEGGGEGRGSMGREGGGDNSGGWNGEGRGGSNMSNNPEMTKPPQRDNVKYNKR